MRFDYVIFCDGGCYTFLDKKRTTPSYFSYQIWTWANLQAFHTNAKTKPLLEMSKFYLRFLLAENQRAPTLIGQLGETIGVTYDTEIALPPHCSIYDDKQKETNNIAEYTAVYYALLRFSLILTGSLQLISDSQLVIHQLQGLAKCKKAHLKPWYYATQKLASKINVSLLHVKRDIIVKMLGH